MREFIEITNDGENITSPMPPDETIVEVKLKSGYTALAWYSCNIMDAGDWEFLPVKEGEPDLDATDISDDVVAWRETSAAHALTV